MDYGRVKYRLVNGDDATGSAFGVSPLYQTHIKTKLATLVSDYYRIASADVQALSMQGSLLTACNVIEEQTGIVIIPKKIGVLYNHFPTWGRTLEIPRGPVLTDVLVDPPSVTYTLTEDAAYGETMPFVAADADAGANDVARLMVDRTFPFFKIVSGQIWPVPLWGSSYPVKVVATFGALSPTFWAANTVEDCYIQNARVLTPMLQLALHLYENRMPVNIGNIVSPIPFTLQALIDGLKQ